MSVRLTTSLQQRLVLTPQLRQRIEMLQMTSLELTDLIQQQMNENPVLEEVATQEEARELAEKILDHMASGGDLENLPASSVEPTAPELGQASSNGTGESENAVKQTLPEAPRAKQRLRRQATKSLPKQREMLLKKSISAVSFRTISTRGTRPRNSNTKKTRPHLSSF